ncbi:short chain oxidoreductase [Penicillium nucicola]|uniref:short chain oxidoreductase n=1 Tax=Penicillium nucicola TaxID=1850975 RepID=UPI002545A588|nr:short chain oxidoreductase [Penicillium nucicola]KAJ5747017.1 short chain oxidoreductase [Penicillium nucicola]
MSSYLITGSSQGIGLELMRQLAAKPEENVGTISASSRSSNNSEEIPQQHPGRIIPVLLDVADV